METTTAAAATTASLQIAQPHAFINALYRDSKSIAQVIRGVEAVLNEGNFSASVPLVRGGKRFMTALPPSGTLVRMRCMVQDVYGTELYDASSSSPSGEEYTGAFGGDILFPKDTFGKNPLGDRLVLACMNIPGESPWVHSHASSVSACSGCRSASGMEEEEEENEEDAQNGSERKRIRMDAEAVIHELPDCIVKVYDADVFESFKVNHVYEFVGVLEYSPEESDCGMEIDDSDAFYKSIAAKNPPRSMVPRIVIILNPFFIYLGCFISCSLF